MEEIKSPVLRFVVHGHLVLAIGAGAQVWWADEVMTMFADARLPWFVGLAVVAVYGAMRLARMHMPGASSSPIMTWYRLNTRVMVAVVVCTALAALIIAWPLRASIIHALWLPAVLSLFYTVPLSLTGGRIIGLRRIPALKAFLIAAVWASVTTLLPATSVVDGVPVIGNDGLWIALVWAGFYLGLAMAFDIRDLPYDLPSLHTFPQVMGVRATRFFAVLALVPLLCTLLLMAIFSYHPIEKGWREPGLDLSLVLPAFGVLLVMVVIVRSAPQRPWWHWSLLLDGSLILLPLLAWIGGIF